MTTTNARPAAGPDADDGVLADLTELVHGLCERYATPPEIAPIGIARDGAGGNADTALWTQLVAAGVTAPDVPEEQGGLGLTFAAAAAVVAASAYHAVDLPVVEAVLLAPWLRSLAGLTVDAALGTAADGVTSLTIGRRGEAWVLDGVLTAVPWGRAATRLVVLGSLDDAPVVLTLDPGLAVASAGANVAGEPRDTLVFEDVTVPDAAVVPISGCGPAAAMSGQFTARAAAGRALQLASAARRATDTTYRFVGEREQFGRPLLGFQTVRQLVVQLSEWSTLMTVAAHAAASPAGPSREAAAAAKCVTSDLADSVARTAHQLHGAIGATVEYPLHRHTARLWAWSSEHGTARYWARVLGADARGPGRLWDAVTALG